MRGRKSRTSTKRCAHPFLKSRKKSKKRRETRIFNKRNTPVHFKPVNTPGVLFTPEDKTPRQNRSNVVYAVQRSEECTDLGISESKQTRHRRMARHRGDDSSARDSGIQLHLKDKGQSFEGSGVHVWARKERWFERGVKSLLDWKNQSRRPKKPVVSCLQVTRLRQNI